MKYDVFISYSSDDQKVVEGLCAYLEQHKVRCFVAYRDIPHGIPWARAIVEALDESRMMVVVFSENFNNSEQVDREIEIASEDKKPILTFRISDDSFKGAKKYYLKNLNWIDAFPRPEQVFGRVLEDVCKLLDIGSDNEGKPTTKGVVKEVVGAHIKAADHFANKIFDGINYIADNEDKIINFIKEHRVYNVGDYYDDGEKQGVVFDVWDEGRHGKIVSLNQTTLQWCTRTQYVKEIVVGIDSKSNGKDNTDKVMARRDADQYPAFTWCRNKGADWYLPAIDELELLLLNDSVHDAVNKTLNQKCGTKLYDKGKDWEFYWSSTEYNLASAWGVDMRNGTLVRLKNDSTYVRAVSAF